MTALQRLEALAMSTNTERFPPLIYASPESNPHRKHANVFPTAVYKGKVR